MQCMEREKKGPRKAIIISKKSTKHALAIALCRRAIRTREFVEPSDAETLRRWDVLVFQTMWVSAVEDTDAHHGEQLCRVSVSQF